MAWDRGGLTGGPIDDDAMTPALSSLLNIVTFEVTDAIGLLYEIEASGSRITTVFNSASSTSARLVHKTS